MAISGCREVIVHAPKLRGRRSSGALVCTVIGAIAEHAEIRTSASGKATSAPSICIAVL